MASVLFMGTPDFAVPALQRLLTDGQDVVAVMTQPDRPAGRGQVLEMPPVKRFALERGVLVLQPESVDKPEIVARLQDLGLSCPTLLDAGLLRTAEWFIRARESGAVRL